jgi:hypothetical protein
VNTEIADAMKDGVDNVLVPVAKDAGNVLKNAVHSVAHGSEAVAEAAEKNEAATVADLEKAVGKKAEQEVPVYLMKDDGTVLKLGKDGSTHEIKAGEESSGIDALLDKDGKIVPQSRGKEYRLKRDPKGVEGPRVHSTPVDPAEGELPQATLRARRALGDGGGTNYAAAKYDAEGGKFILVGRSGGPHSESTVGIPFLRKGMGNGVTHLYTERAPCRVAQHFCGEWLHQYFKGTTVTHAFQYGPGKESQELGNAQLAEFLKGQGL